MMSVAVPFADEPHQSVAEAPCFSEPGGPIGIEGSLRPPALERVKAGFGIAGT